MADPADAKAAFRAAMAEAERKALAGETPQTLVLSDAAAVAPETPAVAAAEAETGATPEQQPTVAETVTPTETPAPAATPAAPAVQEADEVAELRRQLAERDARIAEQQSMIGRQSTEVGELRTAVEEIRQRQAAPPRPVIAITQDMIENDPAAATQLAFAQENEQALNLAFDAWKLEDPVTAAQWYADRRAEAVEASFNARLEAIRQELATAAAPAQEVAARQAQQESWNEALRLAEADNPGVSKEVVRLLEEVAPQFPATAKSIAEGDAKAKAEGLALLYSFDRGKQQDPAAVAQAAAEEARAAAEAAAAARAGAAVVTQDTAGQGGAAPELTPEQEESQRTLERYKAKAKPFGGTWVRG